MEQLEFPAPGIGHNNPPEPIDAIGELQKRLAASHADLLARFRDLELGCARVPDPIGTEEEAGLTTDFIAQCQLHIKTAEAAHRREKALFLQSGRVVDAFFKRRCEALSTAFDPAVTRLKAYRDRIVEAERRRHEAARLRAEEEAQRAAAEAAQHRAEAERLARHAQNEQDSAKAAEQMRLAEAASARATEAQQQASIALEPTRIRGDYGSTAFVQRSWTFEVVDLDQVPRDYMSLDVEVVREAINKDKVRKIPGLRIFQAEALRVRGGA